MLLHLIRHADASPSNPLTGDKFRDLSPFGQKQIAVLAEHLYTRLNEVEVWCSGANRTMQTQQILANTITFGKLSIHEQMYLCTMQTFIRQLDTDISAKDLIIIAHNFGISDLMAYYTDDLAELQTAEYVCIEFDGFSRNELSQGTGTIIDRYRPSLEDS